jgi:hypothetical protein
MYATTKDATKNECYNEQLISIKSGSSNEHRCYNERMLQRTVLINKIMMLQQTQMLQRTNVTTNERYNKQLLSITSGCYNERGGILSADVARACS